MGAAFSVLNKWAKKMDRHAELPTSYITDRNRLAALINNALLNN